MKAIVFLTDRSRHEIEIDAAVLARGKLEFAMSENHCRKIATGAPIGLTSTVRHGYRAGSDDGVPVFVER